MTSIRVTTTTRDRVSHLAQAHGMSQSAYLEQMVKEIAEREAEREFWARMGASEYDAEDWDEFAASEAVALADTGDEESTA